MAEQDDDDTLLLEVIQAEREGADGTTCEPVPQQLIHRDTFLFRTTLVFSSYLSTIYLPRGCKIIYSPSGKVLPITGLLKKIVRR